MRLLIILFALCLIGCSSKTKPKITPEEGQYEVKEEPVPPKTNWDGGRIHHYVSKQYLKERGMLYLILNDRTDGGIDVINLTKDSLEVALLRDELKGVSEN